MDAATLGSICSSGFAGLSAIFAGVALIMNTRVFREEQKITKSDFLQILLVKLQNF